jgi:hypothetical protein
VLIGHCAPALYVVPTPPDLTIMVMLLLATIAGLTLATGLLIDRGAGATPPG